MKNRLVNREIVCRPSHPEAAFGSPKSFFIVIAIGQKPVPQSYGNQRPHDYNVSDAFGVKHVLLQRVNVAFHLVTRLYWYIYLSDLNPTDPEL
jgi:hypothetical protein